MTESPALPPPIPALGAEVPSLPKPRWLPRVLRWLGGAMLIAAAARFLPSEWLLEYPVARYGVFLGFTVLLAVAGWLCTWRWCETKAARTLLALAAAFLPIHALYLGGLVQAQAQGGASHFGRDLSAFSLPELPWATFLPLVLVAGLSFAFVSRVGFAVIVGAKSRHYAGWFLAANGLLLVPGRYEWLTASLACVALGWLGWRNHCLAQATGVLRNWAARWMRALLFVPPTLLLVRQVVLHEPSRHFGAFLLLLAGTWAFTVLPRVSGKAYARALLQVVGLGLGFCGWAMMGEEVNDLAGRLVSDSSRVPTFFLTYGLGIYALSVLSFGPRRWVRTVGGTLAAVMMMVVQETEDSWAVAFVGLGGYLGLLWCSYWMRDRWLVGVSVVALVVWGLAQAFDLWDAFTGSPWLILGLGGLALILFSAYLERRVGPRRLGWRSSRGSAT